jgi:hypothetical protein
MLLSLESVHIVGASVVSATGAMLSFRNGLEHTVLPGSKNMSKRTRGVPQELGRSCRLHGKSRQEIPGKQLQASRPHGVYGRSERCRATVVPPSEGNEVRREGRQEVIVP